MVKKRVLSTRERQTSRFKKIISAFTEARKKYMTQSDIREKLQIADASSAKAKMIERDLVDMVDLRLLYRYDQEECPFCGSRIRVPYYSIFPAPVEPDFTEKWLEKMPKGYPYNRN